MEIDIVIISWARDEALKQVTQTGLDSLFASAKKARFHVVVVESNPDIYWTEAPAPHTIQTLHLDSPFGYHKYLNAGRKLGTAPYVALCNSDLVYSPEWAETLVKCLEAQPASKKALSASPWCPISHGPTSGNRNRVYYGYRVRGEVAGWCIFQKREIYDLIGDLDERFTFWWCDNDYATELQTRGIGHILAPGAIVAHLDKGGTTTVTLDHEKRNEMTWGQEQVYWQKWGNQI